MTERVVSASQYPGVGFLNYLNSSRDPAAADDEIRSIIISPTDSSDWRLARESQKFPQSSIPDTTAVSTEPAPDTTYARSAQNPVYGSADAAMVNTRTLAMNR